MSLPVGAYVRDKLEGNIYIIDQVYLTGTDNMLYRVWYSERNADQEMLRSERERYFHPEEIILEEVLTLLYAE